MPQRDWELEQDFPSLVLAGYIKTSDRDPNYNCVAWAVGDIKHYWYDAKIKGYYWPPLMPSADTLEGWIKVFEMHGYCETEGSELETDYEKIAIYITADGLPEHVARQKASGAWSSKMGKGIDIEHPTLEGLEGELIGRATVIMKRRCKGGRRVFE